MSHLSAQSKSFVILLIVFLIVTFAAIQLSEHFSSDRLPKSQTDQSPTAEWSSYIDNNYPLTFKYPVGWQVGQINAEPGYYVIAITPKSGNNEMRIYINDQDYFALNGLQSSPRQIGGQSGAEYGPSLASAKVGKYYYTFDAGLDTSLAPQFQSILSTVEFR